MWAIIGFGVILGLLITILVFPDLLPRGRSGGARTGNVISPLRTRLKGTWGVGEVLNASPDFQSVEVLSAGVNKILVGKNFNPFAKDSSLRCYDPMAVLLGLQPFAFEIIDEVKTAYANPEDEVIDLYKERKRQDDLREMSKTDGEKAIISVSMAERINESAGGLFTKGYELGKGVRSK